MFDCKVYLGDVLFYWCDNDTLQEIMDAYRAVPYDIFQNDPLFSIMKSGLIIDQISDLYEFGSKGAFLNECQVSHAKMWLEYAE